MLSGIMNGQSSEKAILSDHSTVKSYKRVFEEYQDRRNSAATSDVSSVKCEVLSFASSPKVPNPLTAANNIDISSVNMETILLEESKVQISDQWGHEEPRDDADDGHMMVKSALPNSETQSKANCNDGVDFSEDSDNDDQTCKNPLPLPSQTVITEVQVVPEETNVSCSTSEITSPSLYCPMEKTDLITNTHTKFVPLSEVDEQMEESTCYISDANLSAMKIGLPKAMHISACCEKDVPSHIHSSTQAAKPLSTSKIICDSVNNITRPRLRIGLSKHQKVRPLHKLPSRNPFN